MEKWHRKGISVKMNRELLENVGINYAEGLHRFSGHANIYEKLLKRFPDEPTHIALDEAMEKEDVDAAFAAAHTLKGNTGNLSIDALYRGIFPLVEALRSKDMALAKTLYPEFKEKYEEVVNTIKNA